MTENMFITRGSTPDSLLFLSGKHNSKWQAEPETVSNTQLVAQPRTVLVFLLFLSGKLFLRLAPLSVAIGDASSPRCGALSRLLALRTARGRVDWCRNWHRTVRTGRADKLRTILPGQLEAVGVNKILALLTVALHTKARQVEARIQEHSTHWTEEFDMLHGITVRAEHDAVRETRDRELRAGSLPLYLQHARAVPRTFRSHTVQQRTSRSTCPMLAMLVVCCWIGCAHNR